MYVGDVKTPAKEEGADDQQLVALGFHTFTRAVFLIFLGVYVYGQNLIKK